MKKSDVADTREYSEVLVAAVSARMDARRPREELMQTIKLDWHRNRVNYERLPPDHIEAAHNNLMLYQ